MRHSSGRLWRAVAEFAPETNQRESNGGNPVGYVRKFNYPKQMWTCRLLPTRQSADNVIHGKKHDGSDKLLWYNDIHMLSLWLSPFHTHF